MKPNLAIFFYQTVSYFSAFDRQTLSIMFEKFWLNVLQIYHNIHVIRKYKIKKRFLGNILYFQFVVDVLTLFLL